ncbi:MAG: hypothetical protein PUE25_03845, partial [bacterium]|nr:hypothetical protein [bacterium]
MAPPTTNSPTIITTTGFENPDSASAGDNIPQSIRIVSAQSATISALILPIMNMATVAKRTRIVIIIFSIVFGVEHVLSEGKDTKIILDMQIIQE